MKILSTGAVLVCSVAISFFTGCSTTDSRIRDRQNAFDAAPSAVQAKIRAGQVDVGFTPEQVVMALGKPDRTYTRTTASGATEIWAYEDRKPSFSVGLGVVGGGGGTMVGSGMTVGTGGDRRDDKLRVIFSEGRVSALETRGRK